MSVFSPPRGLYLPFILICVCTILSSCIIHNPTSRSCDTIDVHIISISEGRHNDIVFQGHKDYYYINRGLEKGLNLDDLNRDLLNKNVTLHLPRLIFGMVSSEHIAQLSLDGKVYYTEFDQL